MRKRYKQKSKSCCALCKPHKCGWDKRWKVKELARRMLFERQKYSDL